MTYLLDSDTISFAVRRVPAQTVTARLRSTRRADIATSAIRLGEILFGIIR
jgi:predicted nucleic acid-binding protein